MLADPGAPAAARARAETFPVEASAARFAAALEAVGEASPPSSFCTTPSPSCATLLASLEAQLPKRRSWWSSTAARATAARLAAEHGAEVVALPGNPGFGAANNAGLECARHDVTVLLNPDCELLDASLAALAALAGVIRTRCTPRDC